MLGQSESSKLCNFDQTHIHIVGVLTRHSLSTRAGFKQASCATPLPDLGAALATRCSRIPFSGAPLE